MSKRVKISLAVIVSLIILSLAFGAGCVLTLGIPSPTLGTSSPAKEGLNTSLIDEAWTIIGRNYVEPDKIDSTTLNQGALRGMVQSLNDPYSYYLTQTEYKITQGDFQSSFGGIGASISMN